MKIVPREQCIYGRCKMVNLCKGTHCVGAALKEAGYMPGPNGDIVEVKKP